jgi:Iron-containing redox enzyme
MTMKYATSFSTRLRIKFELGTRPLEITGRPVAPSSNASAWLKDLLVTLYWMIHPSVPLMRAAYDMCILPSATTELMIELAEYHDRHIKEEMNHDEWLLEDLEAIGVTPKEALSRKPLQTLAELVGSQYYWIYHWHPICLLGYIFALEGYPPQRELINRLRKATGAPDAAFRTLIEHSDLDPHHSEELFEFLDSLPLTQDHEQWITSNAMYTAIKLGEMQDKLAVI